MSERIPKYITCPSYGQQHAKWGLMMWHTQSQTRHETLEWTGNTLCNHKALIVSSVPKKTTTFKNSTLISFSSLPVTLLGWFLKVKASPLSLWHWTRRWWMNTPFLWGVESKTLFTEIKLYVLEQIPNHYTIIVCRTWAYILLKALEVSKVSVFRIEYCTWYLLNLRE